MNVQRENPFVLISADVFPDQNHAQRKVLRRTLRNYGLPYKTVEGCYKGDRELSFLVVIDNNEWVSILREVGTVLGQESILWVDEEREAFLLECGGSYRDAHIGKFERVSPDKAETLDGWTYDSAADQYWSVL